MFESVKRELPARRRALSVGEGLCTPWQAKWTHLDSFMLF
jgi:hypothetical protein